MRMRIYHNLDNNQLDAYVLADENRALSGQKKSIREALPECVTEMRKLCIDLAAAATATIYADGYGAIVVTWNAGLMSNAMLLHAGSRERLCNRKLARNKDIEVTTSDDLTSALATVLRSEAACRRANDLDTAPRFEYPAECRDCKRVASWQSTRWTRPTPLAETPADDDADDDAVDATDDVAQAETTVIVEPVEVEHDGVVDVEMVETTEIPAVTVETLTADAVSDDYRQYTGMWASADGARAWVGADGAVWVHFDHPDDDYESWVKQDTPNGAACAVRNAFVACGWTHLSADPADDVPRYVTDSGAAKPGTVCADDFERGWRYDGLGAVTRDYAAIPAPRAVVSAPALPAECEAVTTVIPEVPPTTNSDAHVLAVSEDVIPTIARVRDVFPDVPYRAVHAIRRVIENSDGTVSKKKVAYVFRHGNEIQVLRRDRYESAGRDAAVEAEIAAHVARLQRAA